MPTGFIPPEIINDISSRLDIVELIREYVPLKQKGRNLQGLCPFHSEKTPSFTVSPDKQIFHCFGCGVGGNVFSFIMQKEGLTFPEAVEKLALKAGVNLPKEDLSPAQKTILEKKSRSYKINATAALYFQRNLMTPSPESQRAIAYLKSRNITEETIEKFHLGLASSQWDGLINFFSKKGVRPQELVELGLALPNKQGNSFYDRFRNRIIFPIWDNDGKVIAFGGRVLDDSLPKYLNSPDTPLFNKSQHLYGIHLAKNTIRQEDLALIVEGYMDVIACHQQGLKNTVASLGTAFTQQQAKLLMRHTYQIAIIYDGDTAGSSATLRGLDILNDLGCDVKVVNLPQGQDPDDYLQANGSEKLKELIAQGQGLIEYKLIKSMENVKFQSIMGKTKIMQKILPDLLGIKSPVVRAEAIKIVSEKLGITEANIIGELRKYNRINNRPNWDISRKAEIRNDNRDSSPLKLSKTEAQLVKIIFENIELIQEVEEAGGANLLTGPTEELYKSLLSNYKGKGNVASADLDEKNSKILAAVLMMEIEVPDIKKAAADYIKILKINRLNREYAAKNQALKEAEHQKDTTKQMELLIELDSILQQKKLLTP